MKKIVILFLMLCVNLFGQNNTYTAGAYLDYYIPAGGMGERFNPVIGASISFGKYSEDKWQWSGELEYFSMTDGKGENFNILRNVEVAGEDVPYLLPLHNLEVKFEMGGLSANTEYNLISSELVETSVKLGFGFYRWYYSRSAVYDSLYADTTGAGDLTIAADLKVPAVSQTDWSGGFNSGVSLKVKLIEPVLFYANANYKVIIGEIYPSLDLGLENISTFQFVNIKVGFQVRI